MTPFFIVNAFSQVSFKGNPAGVCVLDAPRSDRWMQSVARELGFSETAFLVATNTHYHIRWFSPTTEVALCGHATLAAAHVLWESKQEKSGVIHFTYGGGVLRAQRFYDVIELTFPEDVPLPIDTQSGGLAVFQDLGSYLGLSDVKGVFRSREDLVVAMATEAGVLAYQPDFSAISELPVRALVLTAEAVSQQYDVVSRVFAPRIGIPEDPVTGSAHCAILGYWFPLLQKPQLVCFQASQRGGVVFGRVTEGQVQIGGHALTLFKGEWVV